jgi:hypothetical protein
LAVESDRECQQLKLKLKLEAEGWGLRQQKNGMPLVRHPVESLL